MNDETVTVSELKKHIQDFSDTRGWYKDQNAKDLVMALTVEAAELAEIFMWTHSDKVDEIRQDPKEFEHLREELADVFWYLCRICGHFEIDLAKAVEDKTVKNGEKYPAL
ncbi:nucleotide pyrophosphohydrolase [Allofournierella sp.]|uniref:nucleotide pyrophosphohydrolase n=1 Tax=Allofournierella sp. TaxID=1940256 RepID=UPI003AB3B7AF